MSDTFAAFNPTREELIAAIEPLARKHERQPVDSSDPVAHLPGGSAEADRDRGPAGEGQRRPRPEGRLLADIPDTLPLTGRAPAEVIASLIGPVLADPRALDAPGFFAHMDPPTPWITWVMNAWTASRNQNLLHIDTGGPGRAVETRVIDWLAPEFGMNGGHMVPGSSVANLTAVWAARQAGAAVVVASDNAHLSVPKAAHLLAMEYRAVSSWDEFDSMADAARCVAVITAGTTSSGEIEPLYAASAAGWRHVDAAWAGPLVLSERYGHLLDGIEQADSVAVSAHKWFFQPKESALVLFADVGSAHESISFGADYLAVPNIGLLGSHGAAAVPLLATLLTHGRAGVVEWIDITMRLTDELAALVDAQPQLEARSAPHAGVLNWRHRTVSPERVQAALPAEIFVSTTTIEGESWLRSVAANPLADPAYIVEAVVAVCSEATGRA